MSWINGMQLLALLILYRNYQYFLLFCIVSNSSSGFGSILAENCIRVQCRDSFPQIICQGAANCEAWEVGGCGAVGALWKLGGTICAGYGPHFGVWGPRMCFLIFVWVLQQRIK